MGIDQSYSGFGVALVEPDGRGTAIKHAFPASRSSGAARLDEIAAWFGDVVIDSYGSQLLHVCMEDYARGMRNGREEAGELGGLVKLELYRRLPHPVRYPTVVSPSSLKKYATGSGSAAVKKQQILLAVYKKWGEEFKDDNQADAYVLAKIAHALHYGGEQLVYERDVTDKLRRHTEWVRS